MNKPTTPRDVLRHVFAPVWTYADPADLALATGLEATAVALPGRHSIMVTAAPGPNATRVWAVIIAPAQGAVSTGRHLGPLAAAAQLAGWAGLNGIPHHA